jgi:hypothetical protein
MAARGNPSACPQLVEGHIRALNTEAGFDPPTELRPGHRVVEVRTTAYASDSINTSG